MKYSFEIVNAQTNELFANVYIKEDGSYAADGVSFKGIEWAQWLNSSSSGDIESTLPPYVRMVSVDTRNEEHSEKSDGSQMRLIRTATLSSKSILPQLRDIQLVSVSPELRTLAINYKARAFESDSHSSTVLAELRNSHLTFNPLNGSITGLPSFGFKDYSGFLYGRYQPGLVRHEAIQVINEKMYAYQDKKYIDARLKQEKSAFKKMRRFVSARFDPRAHDADGDGFVQEGTQFQRPVTPRPKLREELASRVSQRRGNMGASSPMEFGKQTQRSSGSVSRGPVPSRLRSANVERTARNQSAPLPSSGSKSRTSKQFQGRPGVDRASSEDGKIWSKLTPEEKAVVARRARALEDQRFYQLTGETPGGRRMPFTKRFRERQEFEKNRGNKLDGPNRELIEQMATWVEEYVNKPNIPPKAKLEVQRFYDELVALYNMRTEKDVDTYEFIEHLHPSGKAFLFNDDIHLDGTTSISPKQKAITSESTAFLRAGGYEKDSPIPTNTRSKEPAPKSKKPEDVVGRIVDSASRNLINRLLNPKNKKK